MGPGRTAQRVIVSVFFTVVDVAGGGAMIAFEVVVSSLVVSVVSSCGLRRCVAWCARLWWTGATSSVCAVSSLVVVIVDTIGGGGSVVVVRWLLVVVVIGGGEPQAASTAVPASKTAPNVSRRAD